MCGHPMRLCRDRKTAGTWQVVVDICEASRVAQVQQENNAKNNVRGAVISTRRS